MSLAENGDAVEKQRWLGGDALGDVSRRVRAIGGNREGAWRHSNNVEQPMF